MVTRAVDCKTTVVKAGGRAASLCVANTSFPLPLERGKTQGWWWYEFKSALRKFNEINAFLESGFLVQSIIRT